ncbi:hypothetical protein SH528x_002420 [Novipirellula sp. SH528]|uniref:hypothetical protein n=1 Tax=Novipirellula sp. SH528 TaxID=3454466 RepID=UPI003F9FBC2D
MPSSFLLQSGGLGYSDPPGYFFWITVVCAGIAFGTWRLGQAGAEIGLRSRCCLPVRVFGFLGHSNRHWGSTNVRWPELPKVQSPRGLDLAVVTLMLYNHTRTQMSNLDASDHDALV